MIEIIMPVYNAGGVLERAIKSVIRQDFTDWKLWIVDDGSTDLITQTIINTYEMLESHKIKVIRKRNGGPASARNFALASIKSDSLIAYCDADDYWFQYHLQEKSSWLSSGYDMVYSNPFLADENNNVMYPNFPLYNDFKEERLRQGNFIFTPTVLHRNGIGLFDSSLDGLEDYDYWIRAVKSGYKIYQSSTRTCTCTVRINGINNMSSKGQNALAKIKEKHKDFLI